MMRADASGRYAKARLGCLILVRSLYFLTTTAPPRPGPALEFSPSVQGCQAATRSRSELCKPCGGRGWAGRECSEGGGGGRHHVIIWNAASWLLYFDMAVN